MNRKYFLDSLDGLKALVFRLLPAGVAGSIACVPMTTDGPWSDGEKAAFETAIGIPADRTFWAPGGFVNVPPSRDQEARSKWVQAVAAIDHRYLFLDPDIGFYTHLTGPSEKTILINQELAVILQRREALVIYRHMYWPNPPLNDVPQNAIPYVWHCLRMLREAGFAAFAYQSRAASLFFAARHTAGIAPFESGLRLALSGVSAEVVNRRLVV